MRTMLDTMVRMALLSMVVFSASTFADNQTSTESYAIAPGQGTDIASAIDASTADMSFVIRPIARSRLRENNVAYQRIRIVRTPSAIEIACDAQTPIRMPIDGTPVANVDPKGEKSEVSIAQQDSKLIQTFKSADGVRVNTFRSSSDGKTLQMDVQTSSARLPKPVSYSLLYRRTE